MRRALGKRLGWGGGRGQCLSICKLLKALRQTKVKIEG